LLNLAYSVFAITSVPFFGSRPASEEVIRRQLSQGQWLDIRKDLRALVVNVFPTGGSIRQTLGQDDWEASRLSYVCHRQVEGVMELVEREWIESDRQFTIMVVCPYNAM
jgi:hypothetical protein